MKGPELAQKSDLRFAYGIKYPEHEDFVYWSSGLDRVPSYPCGICKDGDEYSVVQQVPEQFQNRPTPISLATLLNHQFLYPYRQSRHISLRYAPLSHAERSDLHAKIDSTLEMTSDIGTMSKDDMEGCNSYPINQRVEGPAYLIAMT
ncbi:hypothetical protein HYALB_00009589 [Hymenoscyphus albidus]|uniref:Uncharacterized protein n=1 Tax=Hymenoscyphus albidus TaxID=595503 RepID=A0A9N9QDY3_9HELO|nr:hypothetical protein HYALB_00009589 [Hymenoscyphus albidus]